ncbi:leucine-rich repeat and fibronectin type-III domain-containing protein 5-like, partial [Sinocyclocheilus anshuiensis]|uniref:leucine-rich repeat and fibronectin type-III domain-containing protein 5-like n=1 Tax=Sinocyclocheilus anshuiensis TaxID=1608454 RepID=UPI0007B89436
YDTSMVREPNPGSSDIATSAKTGGDGGSSMGNKGGQEKRVLISEITASTALVKFNFQRNIPGIRMFQVQYNGTYDDSLVYRMIPPTSKSITVKNLAAGTTYDLCVLAIYDDAMTALTATRVVGCVHFSTEPQYLRCHFMQSQFLGGTIVVIIGGVIVASVLAFIIFLIVRYRLCQQEGADKGLELGDVRSLSEHQVCGIIKSMSKQVLGPDACRKVSPQSESVASRASKPVLPDCTVTTSAASHSWHPASPSPVRPARTDTQVDVEPDNTNRNNSAKVRPAVRAYSTIVTLSSRRALLQSLHNYQTIPAGCVRASRRHSLNVNSCKQPAYAQPLRSKRSLSMSGGDIPQMDSGEIRNGRPSLSQSEWVLESTL